MYSYGPPHMAVQKQDDQHEHTFNSCVRIRDAVLRTCQGRWTIGSGERGSGISVLPAWHDDDYIYIYIYIYIKMLSSGFSFWMRFRTFWTTHIYYFNAIHTLFHVLHTHLPFLYIIRTYHFYIPHTHTHTHTHRVFMIHAHNHSALFESRTHKN